MRVGQIGNGFYYCYRLVLNVVKNASAILDGHEMTRSENYAYLRSILAQGFDRNEGAYISRTLYHKIFSRHTQMNPADFVLCCYSRKLRHLAGARCLCWVKGACLVVKLF